MRWEYFGTGLALIGIGISLMVALPPPWWPRMPVPLVHIGVIVGAVLIFVGIVIAIFGAWPILPIPKVALLGMGFSALLLIGFAIWFWALPNFIPAETPDARPLKRLIAYTQSDLDVPWDSATATASIHGFNLRVANVSDDTITAHLAILRVDVDGTEILKIPKASDPIIVPQTQGATFQYFRANGDFPIPWDAKIVTVEFEVDYDTIPETGTRQSYRKLSYPINWANGKDKPPLLNSHTTSEEWEK